MNILWLSHNVPYPPVSGALQRSYNLLKRVAAHHNVYLLAFNQKALLPTDAEVEHAKTALGKICSHIEVLPIPSDASRVSWYTLVLRSLFTRDPYAINWLKSQEMHRAIKEMLVKVRFDLVRYDTISLVEYFSDAGNLPKVLDHQNIESFMMRRRAKKEKNILKKAYFACEAMKLESVEKAFCSRADVNLVVSQVDAGELKKICTQALVELCENGCDTQYFSPSEAESPERGRLMFVGNLKWYPNRDGILYFCNEVWPQLAKRQPFVKLSIVGAHPPEELLSLASRDERIEVTGYVDDVRPYFHNADIFICPIRDGGGTRLKLLDAMAMGKPIITTSIGCEGIDLVPGEDALFADMVQDFVIHIEKLLSNPSLKAELGARARRLAERKYSWDIIGERLVKVYECLSSTQESRGCGQAGRHQI